MMAATTEPHKHVWEHPYAHDWMIVRCKCGQSAKLMKCRKCKDYTPHQWTGMTRGHKGGEKSYTFSVSIEEVVCLNCGTKKTINRVQGSRTRSLMPH
jgi:hypothetical protein